MTDWQPYLDFAVQTAYRAGRLTLGYYQTGLRPDFKADDTPVTAADRAAEEFIRAEIERRFPGHAILGEEFGFSSIPDSLNKSVLIRDSVTESVDQSVPIRDSVTESVDQSVPIRDSVTESVDQSVPIRESGPESVDQSAPIRDFVTESVDRWRWLIDPIDGTKSFVRGVPLYGVLIGLEVEGVVRVGAAYFPALDEMLCAADGLGCWWNGRRARVSEVARMEEAYVCYTNLRNMPKYGRQAAFERLNARAFAMRGWSDAYGYLLVATGRAEVMLDPVMNVWDCGPFPPIFREAGGYFGSWSGEEGHTYGEAIACNGALKDEILRLVNGE